jgi:hypothetical protein
MVTTRRRLIPQGTSFSFLHAVTQALQSMHRSASQRNFMRTIVFVLSFRPVLAKGRLRLLHASRWIVAAGRVHDLAEHDWIAAFGTFTLAVAGSRTTGNRPRLPHRQSQSEADRAGPWSS